MIGTVKYTEFDDYVTKRPVTVRLGEDDSRNYCINRFFVHRDCRPKNHVDIRGETHHLNHHEPQSKPEPLYLQQIRNTAVNVGWKAKTGHEKQVSKQNFQFK